jgi:predicted ferric reductase
MLTGIPYQHFNFLHRWCGRIIFAQAALHTIGWTVVEAYYYGPAPDVYYLFLTNMYAVFGCVATFLITFLTVFSMKRVIRWTGYEFFKITHSIGAILYIGACWGHWDKLWCWMVASLVLIAIDQSARLLKTCYLHFGGKKSSIGFRRAMADVQIIGEGDDVIVRLDYDFEQEAWEPGQHFYLCFPSLSIWQSHPFTVSSMPDPSSKVQHHTYLLRARKGQTVQLAALAGQTDVPVIMTGPYGPGWPQHTTDNVLAVAGGTGVTFTLPIVIASLRQLIVPQATVDFVWVIRRAQDLLWLNAEFVELKQMLAKNPGLRINIFVTREDTPHIPFCCNRPGKQPQQQQNADPEKGPNANISPTSSSSESDVSNRATLQELLAIDQERFHVELLGSHHPTMPTVVTSFMERASKRGGFIQVVGSGPESMGSDLRTAISQVEEKDGLDFYWDSRE